MVAPLNACNRKREWSQWYRDIVVESERLFLQFQSDKSIEHFKNFIERHVDIVGWFGSVEWHWADEEGEVVYDSEQKVLKLYMFDTADGRRRMRSLMSSEYSQKYHKG